jgi:anti-sigma B factor antagonist
VPFAIREHQRDDLVVLALGGELDMDTAPGLQERIEAVLAAGRRRVLLNVAELSFCDSAGLNAFIQGDRACAARGGWLRLTGATGHVARVIELSGLDEVLTHRPDGGTGDSGDS